MPRFHTIYSVAKKAPHIYDATDKVDRLTYVDPVLQIQNFQRAGINYALQNGQCLYQSMNEVENMEVPTIPTFSLDPVDVAQREARYREMRADLANKKEAFFKAKKAQEERLKHLESVK